jgi:cobalt-zinc-cadmium resistance protein CzcA
VLARIVRLSIRLRYAVMVFFVLLLGVGAWATAKLPIDAMPDVSSVQVTVLTTAAGLSPREVERTITIPIEIALNGVPRSIEMRGVSRAGLSVVTLIFEDGADIWLARQIISERLRGVMADLPASAATPELAPVTSALGKIYQFVVRSSSHSAMQLRTLLDWEIVPQLRNVPGVIEVNTMGGYLKQYQVVIDHAKLRARGITLQEVMHALRSANLNVGGGYVERGSEAFVIRGQGILRNEKDIETVVLKTDRSGTPVLVRHIGVVQVGHALRYGVTTYNGNDEAVTGIVMMLLGSNSRTVVKSVGERVRDIQANLPPGVVIETVYDRADFVGRTISTVLKNLAEGVFIVVVLLIVLLGSFRGALAVVLGIPASMSVAVLGMHVFGVTGDLMSLGAIDFGFLVDGPIVILEAVSAAAVGKVLTSKKRIQLYEQVAQGSIRPVAFAVAIIMLVYMPLLALKGVEGKMFKPMAITMACALLGTLIYSTWFFPAILTLLVKSSEDHEPRWVHWLSEHYKRLLVPSIRHRWKAIASAAGLLLLVGWAFSRAGAEFVPRIFEGDALLAIRRAPSVSIEEAKQLDLQAQKILLQLPEIRSALAMTGRTEVAVDAVGLDSTDLLVRLKPQDEWKSAHDFDGLSVLMKDQIESQVPGTFVSVSQPIEDYTNELISGSRADVAIKVFGKDLEELARTARRAAEIIRPIQGTGDIRVEQVLGQPTITATANRVNMSRYGVKVSDALMVLEAAKEGVQVGNLYDEDRRFELRVLYPLVEPTAAALGQLYVEASSGSSVPLHAVVDISETEGPTSVRHVNRERTVRVDVNLRGRDLVSWVEEAKTTLTRELKLKPGYRVEWGGQFENFERAQKTLAVVVPIVILIIFSMLLWMFNDLRLATAVFVMVPFSLTGGMLGLLSRGLPFSLPAAVGFIALGGIAVLNGVVMASEISKRLDDEYPLMDAILEGSTSVLRAVLTTAAVAALGFLPMALASSAGAEVQRPLATVVIVGIVVGTVLTLFLLPGCLYIALRGAYEESPAGKDTSNSP